MAWWLGKSIGRPKGGWIRRGLEKNRQRAGPMYGQDPTAPMGGFDQAATQGGMALGSARGAQGDAMGLMAGAARGQGPSVAQQQLAAQSQQSLTNQMGMAAQARGGNLASQARSASAMGAANDMALQQQSAQLRAAEMQAAQQAYANQANAMAQQGLQQQGMGLGLQSQYGLGQRGLDLQQVQGNRDFGTGIMGGVAGMAQGAAAIGMMSDERNKQDIQPGDMAASRAVGAMNPVTFQYKSPAYGQPGTLPGILAQDLERTPEGQALVTNTPAGKVVDRDAGLGLALAASAAQEKRIRELESMLQGGGLAQGQAQAAGSAPVQRGPVFFPGYANHKMT